MGRGLVRLSFPLDHLAVLRELRGKVIILELVAADRPRKNFLCGDVKDHQIIRPCWGVKLYLVNLVSSSWATIHEVIGIEFRVVSQRAAKLQLSALVAANKAREQHPINTFQLSALEIALLAVALALVVHLVFVVHTELQICDADNLRHSAVEGIRVTATAFVHFVLTCIGDRLKSAVLRLFCQLHYHTLFNSCFHNFELLALNLIAT